MEQDNLELRILGNISLIAISYINRFQHLVVLTPFIKHGKWDKQDAVRT